MTTPEPLTEEEYDTFVHLYHRVLEIGEHWVKANDTVESTHWKPTGQWQKRRAKGFVYVEQITDAEPHGIEFQGWDYDEWQHNDLARRWFTDGAAAHEEYKQKQADLQREYDKWAAEADERKRLRRRADYEALRREFEGELT